MTNTRLVCLMGLADKTGLPVAWLKREADAGRIAYIQAGRRRFFDTAEVLKALSNRPEANKAANDSTEYVRQHDNKEEE